MAHVIIYTTPTCGYCKMAKAFFKEHDVQYEEKDVSIDHAAADEMVQKSSQMGVPVIDIGGSIVVGFDKDGLSRLLNIQ